MTRKTLTGLASESSSDSERSDGGASVDANVTLSALDASSPNQTDAESSWNDDAGSSPVSADAGMTVTLDGGEGGPPVNGEGGPSTLCGDGFVNEDEACDDGNEAAGDGCQDCEVEPYWRCDEGQPCTWLLVDQPCIDPCWAGDACIEVGIGVTCECPAVQPQACQDVHFRSLPLLGNQRRCISLALSGDGNTAVGVCYDGAEWQSVPVIWRANTLPELIAPAGQASAVNHDGTIIARWEDLTGPLLVPPNEPFGTATTGVAHAISDDGSLAVGEPFIWSDANGYVALHAPDGDGSAIAYDMSDSTTEWSGPVVGQAWDQENKFHAVTWTLEGEGTWLPRLPGAIDSTALSVSADGSVIVGIVTTESESISVRWTEDGVEALPAGQVFAVSADGSTILGRTSDGPWLYDDIDGVRSVVEILEDLGVELDDWSLLIEQVSADGHTLAGWGRYTGGNQTNPRERPVRIHLP